MDWETLGAMAAIVFGAVGLQSFWVARELDAIDARFAGWMRGSTASTQDSTGVDERLRMRADTRFDALDAEVRREARHRVRRDPLEPRADRERGGRARPPTHAASKSASNRQPATAAPVPASSWPNFARFTYWPMPGFATSSSFSTRTFPRSSTISGEPITSVSS